MSHNTGYGNSSEVVPDAGDVCECGSCGQATPPVSPARQCAGDPTPVDSGAGAGATSGNLQEVTNSALSRIANENALSHAVSIEGRGAKWFPTVAVLTLGLRCEPFAHFFVGGQARCCCGAMGR
jgi:hypothetical protein